MVRLRLLGLPSVESAVKGSNASQETETIAVQPKRLALLSYLAVGKPEAYARDKLLGVFWPESDTEHARAALRQAIHFIRSNLRSTLGPDILKSIGQDDLGLRHEMLWCDVWEFESRIAAGDVAGAMALYRGDFLQGIYVPDSPDFEHWAETHRARLKSSAVMACISAAEAELKDNPRGALFWANRGELIAPTSERLVRMIVSLQDRLGDRAGAIAKYEEFAAWLKREYMLDAEAETLALIESIKSRKVEPSRPERRTTPTEDATAILAYHTPTKGRRRLHDADAAPSKPLTESADAPHDDYQDLAEGALEIIYTADAAGNLRSANDAAAHILGYSVDELRGKSLLGLVEREFRPTVVEFYARQVQDSVPTTYYEFPVKTRSGDTVWLGQIVHLIEKEAGVIQLLGVARDISAQRDVTRPRAMFAWRDPLTGLYNGEAFVVLAEHRRALATETGIPLEFLTVSLSNFRELEREHGETEAQRALVLTAQALQETFRRSDIIAHFARNRFVILGSDWNGAGICTTRLRERIVSRAVARLGFKLAVSIHEVRDVDLGPAPVSSLLELKAS